jgi:hypothetical protein
VLFRIRVHPLSKVGALSAAKQRELVEQMRAYADFLRWKKPSCSSSTGWRTPNASARAATSPSTRRIWARPSAAAILRRMPKQYPPRLHQPGQVVHAITKNTASVLMMVMPKMSR